MDVWGSEATVTVPSLRQAVDPAFVRSLETDRALQSLYLGGVELRGTATANAGAAIPLERARLSNADWVGGEGTTLSFSTAGGASLRVADGAWDPEAAHVLSFRLSAGNRSPEPRDGGGIVVEIAMSGDLSIPYERNVLMVPGNGSDIAVDLLRLYSYALNPVVRSLVLHFPRAGDYTISDVRLGR
jgi:hypothetical protein